jgi:hypothetical protein
MHLLFAAVLALTQPWLLVSDLHVNPFAGGTVPSGYKDDTNWALFDSTVNAMHRAAPDARVIIISGDFLAHKWGEKVSAAGSRRSAQVEALQTMSRIEKTFARAFPKAQFVIALGNNDDPCGDYRTAPGTPYLAQLAKIWEPAVNRGGAAPQFAASFARSGSYTARLPVQGMRAVVLDDVYWSMFYRPCGRARGNPPAAQLKWLSATLQSAAPTGRDVVIAHIPPGVDPTSTLIAHRFVVVPFLSGSMNAGFLSTLAEHSRTLAFAVAGHMHRNGFRIAGGVPMLLAPSISPIYENNPAFLRLQIGTNGVLQDYQMFAYSEGAREWAQNFDFDSAYGARDVTAAQLAALHARIASDDTLRERWARAAVAGADNWTQIAGAWRAYWCAQSDFGADYVRCAGDQRRAAVLPAALAIFAVLVMLGIVALVLRLARQRRTP